MHSKTQISRVAAYGLIVKNQKILLCRLSRYLSVEAGFWTLPGGGIHFGEDPVDAMIREVHEETGLNVVSKGLAGIDSFREESKERDFHALRIIYHAGITGGFQKNELNGSTDLCAWWTYEETKTLALVELSKVGLALAFPRE